MLLYNTQKYELNYHHLDEWQPRNGYYIKYKRMNLLTNS